MRTLSANTRLRERYRIERTLGRGGQSQVYLAADELYDGVTVVVKNMIYHASDARTRREELDLFLAEAAVLSEVQHPSLPALVDSFGDGEAHFVVEQFCGSTDVDRLLRRRGGRLTVREVAWIGHHMLDLLSHLHAQMPPVVLRDIKPSNITCHLNEAGGVDFESRPWFIDLTIATRYVPGRGDAVKMGSPGYAPPEQYRGMSDPRSDLYALGATMYHALTGHDPVTSPFQFPPVHGYLPDIPRGWDAFFKRALALDPGLRYQSAVEMRQSLDRLVPMSVVQRPLEPGVMLPYAVSGVLPRRRTVLSRPQMVLVIVAAALLMLGLLAALGGLAPERDGRGGARPGYAFRFLEEVSSRA